jgi:hypothetical protein
MRSIGPLPTSIQCLPAQVDSDREATMGHGAMDSDMHMMDMDGRSDSRSAMDIDHDETTNHNPIPQRFNADTCTTGMPDSEIDMPVPNFEPSPPVETIINSADSHWFWRIIMILITWLHLYYHLPHRGCNLILGVHQRIFVRAGMLTDESGVSKTLRTAFRHLGLNDHFQKLPTCPSCKYVHPANTPPG